MPICSKQLLTFLAALCIAAGAVTAQKPQLYVQTGHAAGIHSIVFSPDGKVLASGSSDNTIKLWDVATGQELMTLRGHNSAVNSVAFSRDGKMLATGSSDTTINVWSLSSAKVIKTFKQVTVRSVAFSPDGKNVVASGFGEVKLWDIASGKQVMWFPSGTLGSNSVAFSPDGKLLASGAVALEAADVSVWDPNSGKTIHILQGHTKEIQEVAFSVDGNVLASASHDMTVKLWDVLSGRELRTLKGHSDVVNSLSFSSDGKTLATVSNDKTIRLWDYHTGKELRSFAEEQAVFEVSFSPDGKILASSALGNTMKLRDLASGRERAFVGKGEYITDLAFSPDGNRLASTRPSKVKLWDLTSNGLKTLLTPATTYLTVGTFTPDGQTFAKGAAGDIRFWNVNSATELNILRGHDDSVQRIAFTRDGNRMISASFDKTIKIWDVQRQQVIRTLPVDMLVGELAVSPDGKMVAANAAEWSIIIWDVTSGQQLWRLRGHTTSIAGMAFSPDGKILASGSSDKTIRLWDVTTGQTLKVLSGDMEFVSDVAFSPDGRMLASANTDATVRLWDVASGRELKTIASGAWVTSVEFTRDGKTLASAGYDGTVTLWDPVTGEKLANLITLDERDWAVVTPDGLFDGTARSWAQIFWRFSTRLHDVAPVEIFFNEFYYPGLLQEILSGKRPRPAAAIANKDRRQPQISLRYEWPANSSVSARNVEVEVDVTEAPAGAHDVRLFRNGSLVKVWRGDVLQGKTNVTLKTSVAIVAGENRLTAYAFNGDNIKSPDAETTVTGPGSFLRNGVAYVVAVGVNQYANPEYDLKYAVADARDFSEELRRQQSRLNNYQRVEIIPLTDRDATKANILRSLSELAAKVQPEDAVVIFFAGHGTAVQNRFYLIPHDLGYRGSRTALTATGLQTILAHSISDEELERAVEGVDGGQIILIIDACNSGQALEAEEKRRGPMNSRGLAQLAYEKGMSILTAAQSYQAAKEAARLGHGFLTYALVEEGLKTGLADREPRNGEVVLREWLDYAAQRVPQMQQEELEEKRKQAEAGRQLTHGTTDFDDRLQRPRVFYRRESDARPLVIARP